MDNINNITLSQVTRSLETAWKSVQEKHTDVRDAVMVVYLHPKNDRRGHWAPESWTVAGDENEQPEQDRIDEVHISSHILSQGGRSIMETIVHEAVHSAARARGIKDVSRQSRWHNRRFAAIANEFGLVVERDSKIGHRTPDLTDETVEVYQEAIMWLNDATGNLFQSLHLSAKPTRPANTVKMACPTCKRYFRIGKKQFELGALTCVPCGVEFEEMED